VKMSSRCLAVALLLTTAIPATVMAFDGNPTGPPPIVHGSPMPTDGNPTGPPPKVVMGQ
jgi:hypothetical protein